ncbi:radical SAM/SPASM domain-containing protein [Lacrimispora sp.]|uniref:radical SAM/SPASM domain-containing protein n=1 Tax=Lacrimispora sp. TaxID=2719234 RepID=UPI00289BFA33|nr:SPASM domain-containing protein [Lacrimispora sp.]
MKESAIIFGLGYNYFMSYGQLNEQYDIIALTDNNSEARNWAGSITLHIGREIILPDEILQKTFDKIIIVMGSAANVRKVREQLSDYGIPNHKIDTFTPLTVTPFLIDPMFYETNLTHEQKRKLFAENCETVTIEPNSKCNRRCWFCPNSVIDRNSTNIPMEWEVFSKIITELKEIGYNGIVSYSFYNEPLLDNDLEKKIEYVRNELPNTIQVVSTNGDYLTPKRMASLTASGLDDMIISVYNENNPDFEWTVEKAEAQVWKFINNLSLDVIYIQSTAQSVTAFAQRDGLNVRMQNHDMCYAAHNRGEILSDSLPFIKRTERTTFCMNSFVTMNVYYDGSVYSCGNMRNDFDPHKEFLIGNVADNSIFDIFQSESAQRFRKEFTYNPKQLPCRSCTMEADTFIYQFPTIPFRNRPRYTRKMRKED